MVSGWQTKFSVSPGPGLWSLDLGPFGPDLGPDLDLTWDLDLDMSLTKFAECKIVKVSFCNTEILYSLSLFLYEHAC